MHIGVEVWEGGIQSPPGLTIIRPRVFSAAPPVICLLRPRIFFACVHPGGGERSPWRTDVVLQGCAGKQSINKSERERAQYFL